MPNMIAACTTKARAARPTAAVTTIRKRSSVIARFRLAHGVAISLLAGFHRVAQVFLLAPERFLAAIHPTGRGLAELSAALLHEVRAFAGLRLDVLPCFGARLRRE